MEPTEEDLRLYQACFAANGSTKDLDVLRWLYLHAPAQGTYVDLSVDEAAEGTRVAGISAVLPVLVQVRGQIRTGGQSLDTLTDERYRGRGLFVSLVVSVYERCTAGGIALVYGFPNGHSAPGFFKKLGWVSMDPVPFLIRPLRTGYFASRVPRVGRWLSRLPDLPLPRPRVPRVEGSVEPLAAFGPELDGVWERFSAGVGVAVRRDGAYLDWRFGRRPGEGYQVRALRRGGRVEGLVVWATREKHGGRIGYLMELLHDPARREDGAALLAHAVRGMADEGADAVLAWSLEHAPNHAVYRRAGFIPMPEKLRPIELHFGARALDPALAPVVADRRSWYLSYADSDTV